MGEGEVEPEEEGWWEEAEVVFREEEDFLLVPARVVEALGGVIVVESPVAEGWVGVGDRESVERSHLGVVCRAASSFRFCASASALALARSLAA